MAFDIRPLLPIQPGAAVPSRVGSPNAIRSSDSPVSQSLAKDMDSVSKHINSLHQSIGALGGNLTTIFALLLKAGIVIAGSSGQPPLTILSTPLVAALVNGALEYDGAHLYFTIMGTRYVIAGPGVGGGTVTDVSVASVPAWLSASVANPTTTPAITLAALNESANTVLAGPPSGSPGLPGFRALTDADMPADFATKAGVQQESYVAANDTGSANAYAVTLSPVPTIVKYSEVVFEAAHANTGASTVTVNGTSYPITKNGTTALSGGEINANQIVRLKYDGANMQIVSGVASSGGGSGGSWVVASISALRAISAPTSATAAVVEGYYATQDGGGGTFLWDTTSTASDDGGTIILPTGYGGTGRWRRLYSGAVFVRWFGAKGDGSTDDSSAIQAAINTAASNWGKVSFDGSVYMVGTELSLTTDKMLLSGQVGTILRAKSAIVSILLVSSNNNQIEGIEFDGNSGLGGTTALVIINGAYNILTRSHIHNSNHHGVTLDGQATTCNYNTVSECNSFLNATIGISNNKVTDSTFVANFIQSNGEEGLTFDNASHRCSALGNLIDANASSSGVGNIGVDGSDDCRILGNDITNSVGAGIKTQNNTAATNRLVVASNSITGNGSAGGVWIYNGTGVISNACLVDANNIYNNGSLSIVIASGCTNNVITGNSLNGVAVSDSGSGTVILPSGPDWPTVSSTSYDDEFTSSSLASRWSWVNQGSTSASLAKSRLSLTSPSNGGNNTLRFIEQALPSAPYEFQAKLVVYCSAAYGDAGILLYESGTGKCMGIEFATNGSGQWYILVRGYSSAASGTSTNRFLYGPYSMGTGESVSAYFQVGRDSSNNLYFGFSDIQDGSVFYRLWTEALAGYFTSAPDHVGLYVNPNSQPTTLCSDWFRRTI